VELGEGSGPLRGRGAVERSQAERLQFDTGPVAPLAGKGQVRAASRQSHLCRAPGEAAGPAMVDRAYGDDVSTGLYQLARDRATIDLLIAAAPCGDASVALTNGCSCFFWLLASGLF